jgi:hypothetical protein
MEMNKMPLDRQVVKIKTKGDFMSRFLLLVCLCVLGVLASCKSLCKPEEPAVVPIVEVASEPTSCLFEPAPSSPPALCKIEPLTAEPVAPVVSIVEPRPEPEVQPFYTHPFTKEPVSKKVAEHYITVGRLQMGALVLVILCLCMIPILVWEHRRFKELHKKSGN